MTDFFWPHELRQARLPYPSLSPRIFSNSCPLRQWSHPTNSSSTSLFSSCPQYCLASGSFPVIQSFISGGQNTGASASASVLSVNIQGWFPLGLTALISLLPKGFSRVFPSIKVQKHQCLVLSLHYGPTLTTIHDCWKNYSFDCMDFCQQSDVSTF